MYTKSLPILLLVGGISSEKLKHINVKLYYIGYLNAIL